MGASPPAGSLTSFLSCEAAALLSLTRAGTVGPAPLPASVPLRPNGLLESPPFLSELVRLLFCLQLSWRNECGMTRAPH